MSQADERIVMQDAGAYGTVEVPAAPKKSSLKRLVVSEVTTTLGERGVLFLQEVSSRAASGVSSTANPR